MANMSELWMYFTMVGMGVEQSHVGGPAQGFKD